jgi:hypothetical protein
VDQIKKCLFSLVLYSVSVSDVCFELFINISSGDPDVVFFQLWVCTGVAGFGTVLATFGVCSSRPPTPPTASAAEGTQPFFIGLKTVCFVQLTKHGTKNIKEKN